MPGPAQLTKKKIKPKLYNEENKINLYRNINKSIKYINSKYINTSTFAVAAMGSLVHWLHWHYYQHFSHLVHKSLDTWFYDFFLHLKSLFTSNHLRIINLTFTVCWCYCERVRPAFVVNIAPTNIFCMKYIFGK